MTTGVALKFCPGCKQTKPVEQFSVRTSRRDGRYPYCSPCNVARVKKWHQENPERSKAAQDASRMRRRFGMEIGEFQSILADQDGVCAICRGHDKEVGGRRLSIDHDHATNKNRGLLCARCNRLLGSAGDSIELLEAAIIYLRAHQ